MLANAILSAPALVVDRRLTVSGCLPREAEILEWLRAASAAAM
mgnify:CR=1 FL=1